MSLANSTNQPMSHDPKELRDMSIEADLIREDRVLVASQWQLMWWKFRKHKLALVASVVIVLVYVMAALVEFVAPYDPEQQEASMAYRPPTRIHFVDAEGRWHLRPFVYGTESKRDLESLSLVFADDRTQVYPIYFVTAGTPYRMWGRIASSTHLLSKCIRLSHSYTTS